MRLDCAQARAERVVFGIAGGVRSTDQSSFLLPCFRDPRQPCRSRCARRFRWHEIVRRRGEKPHEGFLASITSVWLLSKIPARRRQPSQQRRQVLDEAGNEVAHIAFPLPGAAHVGRAGALANAAIKAAPSSRCRTARSGRLRRRDDDSGPFPCPGDRETCVLHGYVNEVRLTN